MIGLYYYFSCCLSQTDRSKSWAAERALVVSTHAPWKQSSEILSFKTEFASSSGRQHVVSLFWSFNKLILWLNRAVLHSRTTQWFSAMKIKSIEIIFKITNIVSLGLPTVCTVVSQPVLWTSIQVRKRSKMTFNEKKKKPERATDEDPSVWDGQRGSRWYRDDQR